MAPASCITLLCVKGAAFCGPSFARKAGHYAHSTA